MKVQFWLLGGATVLLAACGGLQGTTYDTADGFIELPEGVLSVAAPYQDLQAVRLDQENRCFVYRHVGPVETTYLPLRSVDGRPICTRSSKTSKAG